MSDTLPPDGPSAPDAAWRPRRGDNVFADGGEPARPARRYRAEEGAGVETTSRGDESSAGEGPELRVVEGNDPLLADTATEPESDADATGHGSARDGGAAAPSQGEQSKQDDQSKQEEQSKQAEHGEQSKPRSSRREHPVLPAPGPEAVRVEIKRSIRLPGGNQDSSLTGSSPASLVGLDPYFAHDWATWQGILSALVEPELEKLRERVSELSSAQVHTADGHAIASIGAAPDPQVAAVRAALFGLAQADAKAPQGDPAAVGVTAGAARTAVAAVRVDILGHVLVSLAATDIDLEQLIEVARDTALDLVDVLDLDGA